MELVLFYITRGLTAAALIALAVIFIRRKDTVLMPALFGAVVCFLAQYVVYGPLYNLVFGILTDTGLLSGNLALYGGAEIVFTAVLELVFFLAAALLFQKHLRFDAAVAFGAGYWAFTAILNLAVDAFSILTSQSVLFTGSELDVFSAGIQQLLMLPFYCAMTGLVGRGLYTRRALSVVGAFFLNIAYRFVLFIPTLTDASSFLTVGFVFFLALMQTILILRTGKAVRSYEEDVFSIPDLDEEDGEDGDGDDGEDEAESEAESADEPEEPESEEAESEEPESEESEPEETESEEAESEEVESDPSEEK